MKYKKTTLILLTAILIPQVVFAAWWNPFTWNLFERFFPAKVEVYETIQGPTISGSSATSPTTIAEKDKDIEKEITVKANPDKPKNTLPKTQKDPILSPIPKNNIDIPKDLFNDILQEYTEFSVVVSKEKIVSSQNSMLPSDRTHFLFIKNLLDKVGGDIGYLTTIKDWNPRPTINQQLYLSRISGYKIEFEKKIKQHAIAKKDAEERAEAFKLSLPTITFSASKTTITTNQNPIYISWSTTNTAQCIAGDGSRNSWSGVKPLIGIEMVSPSVTTTYLLTCVGAAGTATQSITIYVSSPKIPVQPNPSPATQQNPSPVTQPPSSGPSGLPQTSA